MRKILVMSLLIALSPGVASCNQHPEKAKHNSASLNPAAGPDQAIEQEASMFSLTGYTTGGAKKWEVSGDSVKIFAKTNEVKLDKMSARIWGKDNQFVNLTSDIGSFNRKTEVAHFEKNVIVTNQEGMRLKTDYLSCQTKSQAIDTEAYVEIERENFKAEGFGLKGRHQLTKVQLNKDVRVEIADKKDKDNGGVPIVITCDGPLEVDYNANIAHFNKNVRVNTERGDIFADKMDVYIDREGNKLIKIVCTGNVRVNQGGNKTFSQKAVYLAEQGKVILSGEPKLIIYAEEMEKGLGGLGGSFRDEGSD